LEYEINVSIAIGNNIGRLKKVHELLVP